MLPLKRDRLILAVVYAGWASTTVGAILEVGHHFIAPDEVSRIVIMIAREAGDPDIDGLNLAVQIADGTFGPAIGPIDLETGTIFAANNTASNDQGSAP